MYGSQEYSPLRLIELVNDTVPSMLAYWDADLRCRYANKAYLRWFGADPRHLLGKLMVDLLGPELFALNEPYVRGALAGKPQEFERIVPGPDGTRRHSLAHYIPDIVDGTVAGFVVQVTEITQQRRAERALQDEQGMRVELEERSRALAESLRERSELLDLLAHEVRQPLNNANAALQAANAALSGAGLTRPGELERAHAVISQVTSSIDNTLAVMALLSRAQPIGQIDSDVDLVVSLAIGDLVEPARKRIVVDRRTTTRTAQMDPSLMRLALHNLLANAAKFSPPDAPITVRLMDSEEPLALLIQVCDQGPGLDQKARSRLFQRGGKGESPQSGHGLGLYIVRRVMELHGGTIDLVDDDGHGACLRLTLPQGMA
ncbi:ATP-binding protein [Aquabacterium sp.]|uniref:sensor histidine kinase n=1 Tax=Aquabacterium sp. TaxID=1872578 RepID=UPI0037849E7E